MRWRGRRESLNVEDRRGMPGRGAGIGVGGLLAVLAVSWLLGVNPAVLLQGLEQAQPPQDAGDDRPASGGAPDEMKSFVGVVLADTEDTWGEIFTASGKTYRPPRLVLFSGSIDSACGFAQAAVGPFYCPADQKVYIDLSFYEDLQDRFGAPGDFAQAYVIAHEIGHHVQNLLGISGRVQSLRQRSSEAESNQLSVLLELQADCLAGVWGHHADRSRQLLESGDVEEGLAAAAAIGDDRLQRQSRGYVSPESFTHGSSEQRVRWFRRGLESGNADDCDTFAQSP